MEDLFGINAHRQSVQENIEKAFDLGFDADNNIEGIEKAKHQVGDIHPNGRWVWTEYAPGKFDWKSLRGKHHKDSQQTTTQSTSSKTAVDISKIPDKEFNSITKILEKKNPEDSDAFRYLESEEMNDKELANFIACAKHFKNDTKNINERTRKWCDKWEKLGEEELNNRKNTKDKDDKKKQTKKPEIKRVNNIDVYLDIVNEVVDETLKKFPKGSDRTKAMYFAENKLRANTKWMLPFTVVSTYLTEVMSEYGNKTKDDKKEPEKKERYLLKPDGTPIDLSKESDENLSFTRSVIMQNIKRFKDDLEHAGKNAHVTRSKLIISISKQEGMLKEVEEEIEKRKKDKQTTTKSTSSKGVDEYINKMADDSKWAALVEVMADIDLSDYETEEEAREAIRSKVSLKKLESAWKKFNKQ
jgi:hypothetical protein